MKKPSEAFKPFFRPVIRRRGEQYFRNDNVYIEYIDEVEALATVEGTSLYDVEIRIDQVTGVPEMNCTCPYFETGEPCKHLWAMILELDKYAAADYELPDNDFAPPYTQQLPPEDTCTTWYQDFNMLSRYARNPTSSSPPGLPQKKQQELSYSINYNSLKTGEFCIRLSKRKLKKNGEWGKATSVKFGPELLASAAAEDKKVLSTLLACGMVSDRYGYVYGSGSHQILIPTDMLDTTLPELLDTNRLYICIDNKISRQTPALQNSLDECWKLVMSIRKDYNDYLLDAHLVHNDTAEHITSPLVITASGWILWKNKLTRFDTSVNFGWVIKLRKKTPLMIYSDQVEDWLDNFHKLANNPKTEFPPELSFETITASPQPILRLTEKFNRGLNDVYGILSFQYLDQEINFGERRTSLPIAGKRQILMRDTESEKEHAQTLINIGFTYNDTNTNRYTTSPLSSWDPPDNPIQSVVELLAQGWEIYLSKKKVKTGSINISVKHNIDWFDVSIESDFGGLSVDTPQILQNISNGNNFIQLSDGSLGLLKDTKDFDQLEVLARIGKTQDNSIRFSMPQVFLLDMLLGEQQGIDWDRKSAETRKRMQNLTPLPCNPSKGFKGKLREYQCEGLGWLHYLREMKLGGCLADDMGLGKTVQALALIHSNKKQTKTASLIVMPKSLIFNWRNEAKRFTPDLQIITHHGTDRNRTTDDFDNADIILTTYGTVRQDINTLKDYTFNYVILDEAQAIKNAATASAKAVRLLSADNRLAMSGTPIENHLGELWSLFEFLNPGMLGTSSWLRDTKSRNQLTDASRELISKAVRPFILRRTKEQVADELPPKTEETIFCEMPPKQQKTYNELRNYYKAALDGKIANDGLAKSKIMVLEALLRLRQTACHPALVKDTHKNTKSGKIDTLMELINDIVPAGHKVLVFSQFTKLLALVKEKLDKAHIRYSYLDGKTRNREKCVKQFQEDPDYPVFLISLKAGGLGLNLTEADYVILLDPWWNPAVESQAIDRAHRIGQKRHVFAYRIVTKDTVEEKILELQQTKRDLADAIITQANSLVSRLTGDDLNILLS